MSPQQRADLQRRADAGEDVEHMFDIPMAAPKSLGNNAARDADPNKAARDAKRVATQDLSRKYHLGKQDTLARDRECELFLSYC